MKKVFLLISRHLKEIAERDYKDSHREVSPLRPAEDAITFDTTGVSIDGVVEFIQEKAKKLLTKDDSLVILIAMRKQK